MKVLLIALALLALAASATSTHTSGSCGCQQTPYPQPPPVHVTPPVHLLPPVHVPPHQPQQCPCQQGTCGGVGSGTPILGQCVEFLRYQCSPTPTPYCSQQCQALRQQCCQQLRHVEPLYRNQAIFSTVLQSIMQHQPQPLGQPQIATLMAAQMAQQLTAMCGLQQQPGTGTCPCSAAAGGVPY